MRGMMSGVYGVSEWIMRFSVINLLWIFFNFPIVLLVMNMLFIESASNLLIVMPLAILAPVIFFPATSAMFASVRDWILKRENKSLVKAYWNYYKDNYKQSMQSGCILTLIWIIWFADYHYFSTRNVLLMFSFLFLGVALFVYTINFFSLLTHYDMKIRKLLKNTLFITIGSPILSGTVTVGCGVILYVSINGPLFLMPFFTWSLLAFTSFAAFYRLYVTLTTSAE